MNVTQSRIDEQHRRAAIEHGIVQVRIEGLEPHPYFFELAEQYIQGEMSLHEAIELFKQAITSQQ